MCGLEDRRMDTQAIVIYEEDLQTRALLKEWLGEAGYRIRIGNCCDPGVDGPCDLVIVSLYMPKQDGPQYVRSIRDAHPQTPLIATSGQFRAGLHTDGSVAHRLGVSQVIAKPLMRTELLRAVRGIMGS
jgi:DNA-binding response OmpR family regulator